MRLVALLSACGSRWPPMVLLCRTYSGEVSADKLGIMKPTVERDPGSLHGGTITSSGAARRRSTAVQSPAQAAGAKEGTYVVVDAHADSHDVSLRLEPGTPSSVTSTSSLRTEREELFVVVRALRSGGGVHAGDSTSLVHDASPDGTSGYVCLCVSSWSSFRCCRHPW